MQRLKFVVGIHIIALSLICNSIIQAKAQDPTPNDISGFAFLYVNSMSRQGLSSREIANQLASQMIWLEKLQMTCSSYFYVNSAQAKYRHRLYQGTWQMMFGPGKTSTSIMNEASRMRNNEFNNSSSKKTWCEDLRGFTVRSFGWAPLFQ